MSQLSKQSIRRLCVGSNQPMISPFRPEKIIINGKSGGLSCASYDCHIDHDLTLGINPAHIIATSIIERWDEERLRERLMDNPPMAALAYTLEDFWMPVNVAGGVCDKSTYARVFVSAFNTFFDPGFHGNGTLELVNLGTEPVIYRQGDPVCQFIFNWLDEATEDPYNGKYQHQTKKAHGPRYEYGS
jgi:deoxycytidine triphosphate deaminase